MKSFKHVICILLTALLLVSVVPVSASASENEAVETPLLVTRTEITTGIQGEKTIDVNVADSVAVVEDESIATVAQNSDTGDWVVTGVGVGETNVFISKGEETVTVKVTVVQPELTPVELDLNIGDVYFYYFDGIGENAIWESSDTKVVTVDETGILYAVGKGTARITFQQGTIKLVGTINVTGKISNFTKITVKSATVLNSTSVELKWKTKGKADVFEIQQKKSNKYKTIKTIRKTNAKSAIIKGLKSAKLYTFRVFAYSELDGKDYGLRSNAVKCITLPEKTSFTKVTVNSAHSVSLEWKPVSGATGYLIAKKVKGGQYVFAKDVTSKKAKTTVVKGLKANKNYTFKIQAYKISGENISFAKASKAIKAKTPVKTASSMKFYSKFPQVPDMGFIAGAKCVYNTTVTEKGYDYNMYYYDTPAVTYSEGCWYTEMLTEYGFTYTEKPGLGVKGQTGFVKGNTVVVLMADEYYTVVAVVEK